MRKIFYLGAALLLCLLLLAACAPAVPEQAEDTAYITDMAGREIQLPAEVNKVYTSGQVSTIMLYTLCPDKLLGWNYAPNTLERAFILDEYVELPVYGMGEAVNHEAIIAAAPELIVIAGTLNEAAIIEADTMQERLDIPVALISGELADTPAAYRFFGQLIGESEAAEALAVYAEQTFAWLEGAVNSVPEGERGVTVYYGNGETSLNTAPAGSPSSQVLEMVGALNVAQLEAGSGNRVDISKEQLLAWDPQVVILNGEPKQDFTANAAVEKFLSDPDLAGLKAVISGQVYGSPKAPFSWIDRPPGPNRLIGLYWAFAMIYPQYADHDLEQTIREFYALFYHMELTDEQMTLLLNS